MLKIFFRKMTEEEERKREVGTNYKSPKSFSDMKCQKEPFFLLLIADLATCIMYIPI